MLAFSFVARDLSRRAAEATSGQSWVRSGWPPGPLPRLYLPACPTFAQARSSSAAPPTLQRLMGRWGTLGGAACCGGGCRVAWVRRRPAAHVPSGRACNVEGEARRAPTWQRLKRQVGPAGQGQGWASAMTQSASGGAGGRCWCARAWLGAAGTPQPPGARAPHQAGLRQVAPGGAQRRGQLAR